jgi:SAM-dependent MidA family methyltransferase
VALLRDEILAAPGQRITFARFMERSLAEPGLGYYASSELRPTREGDFLTAPELHPFFGRCLARFVASAWERAGSPRRYVVRELGAGRGTLRERALASLRDEASGVLAALEWQAVDLPERTEAASGPADLVLANELLDALPVHRLVQRDSLREAWVTWQEGWFAETLADPSEPALAAQLAAAGVELRPGQRAEVCLRAPELVAEVAGQLAPGGLLLVIDYGHEAVELYGPRRIAGSLLTYRGHAVSDDPFRAVGHTDLTAHVDLSALQRAAAAAGLALLGHTTQARFLASLGLGELLVELGRDPATDLPTYLEARSSVARFLDPRHLGGFAVLAWGRDRRHGGPRPGAPLKGFDAAV